MRRMSVTACWVSALSLASSSSCESWLPQASRRRYPGQASARRGSAPSPSCRSRRSRRRSSSRGGDLPGPGGVQRLAQRDRVRRGRNLPGKVGQELRRRLVSRSPAARWPTSSRPTVSRWKISGKRPPAAGPAPRPRRGPSLPEPELHRSVGQPEAVSHHGTTEVEDGLSRGRLLHLAAQAGPWRVGRAAVAEEQPVDSATGAQPRTGSSTAAASAVASTGCQGSGRRRTARPRRPPPPGTPPHYSAQQPYTTARLSYDIDLIQPVSQHCQPDRHRRQQARRRAEDQARHERIGKELAYHRGSEYERHCCEEPLQLLAHHMPGPVPPQRHTGHYGHGSCQAARVTKWRITPNNGPGSHKGWAGRRTSHPCPRSEGISRHGQRDESHRCP